MGTGQAGEASENRPMTAVRAAGYSAAAGKGKGSLTLTLTLP